MKRPVISSLLLAVLLLPAFAEYTPPTNAQIDQVLANPNTVSNVLGDANGEQAAVLLARLLDRISDSTASTSQKQYLASFYAARISFLLGNQAEPLLRSIQDSIPEALESAVFSGFSIGLSGSTTQMAILRDIAGENTILLQAVNSPRISLTDPIYNQVIRSLASVQTLPPASVDSITLGIDPATGNPITTLDTTLFPEGTADAPPVPEPYAGQQ